MGGIKALMKKNDVKQTKIFLHSNFKDDSGLLQLGCYVVSSHDIFMSGLASVPLASVTQCDLSSDISFISLLENKIAFLRSVVKDNTAFGNLIFTMEICVIVI